MSKPAPWISGLCYRQNRDGTFLPEREHDSRIFFAKPGWLHVVVANDDTLRNIINVCLQDIAALGRPEQHLYQMRSIFWKDHLWSIVSLQTADASYLEVTASDSGYALISRTYRIPDAHGVPEPFPFSGPNFRILADRKHILP